MNSKAASIKNTVRKADVAEPSAGLPTEFVQRL